MSVSAPVAGKANGLSTVINTIASPPEAFETLRVAPTWGWAFVIALVLLLIGAYLEGPASRHAAVAQLQQSFSTSTLFASLTPEKKQQMLANAGKPSPFTLIIPVFILFIAVFFNTVIMLIGNAVGRGSADFKHLWAGSMNIAVPTLGFGGVITGLIMTLRGPDSFNTTLDTLRAVPSLGTFISGGSPAIIAFLCSISVFTLWGLFLNATMLRVMAKTSSGVAYAFAVIVLLLGAALTASYFGLIHSMGMA